MGRRGLSAQGDEPEECLKDAFDAAYGEKSKHAKAQFEKYRYILRDETAGMEKVIRALVHLKNTIRARKSSPPN